MNIISEHSVTVSLINRNRFAAFLVRDYFDLPRTQTLMSGLLNKRLGQADLVLCLLHIRDSLPRSAADRRRLLAHYIHRLVGRPILVGESCLLKYAINGHAPRILRSRTPSDRKIVWVQETNPRQPQSDAYHRWAEFKVGRTVAQLRSRGVTRRDLRRAERKNWIRLEELA